MAKKQAVNKSKAVREYLKAHPKAMSSEIATALTKQGIKITPGYVANIKTKLKGRRRARKVAAAKALAGVSASPATATAEAPAKPGDVVTIDQIKAVGQMVKTVGGFDRFREMLDTIRQVGGLKRFRDILDAMSLSSTDGIPF
jgi:hypothetical protein